MSHISLNTNSENLVVHQDKISPTCSWRFSLFSSTVCKTMNRYCMEKLEVNHSARQGFSCMYLVMKILLKVVFPFFCCDSLVLELFQVWPQKWLKHVCNQSEKTKCMKKMKWLPYIIGLQCVQWQHIQIIILKTNLHCISIHIYFWILHLFTVFFSIIKLRLWSKLSNQALLGSSPGSIGSRSLFHRAHWRMYHQGPCLSGPLPTESLGSHLETAWAAVKI